MSTSASTSQSTAPIAAESQLVKPKSKRGRKKKILAPAARDAQRARTLARNRAAAQRCRQRKKVEHAALEARARGLARDRAALHTLVGGLRDELLSLKGQMLRHASCADADSGVAAYVQQQREMLMRGMPEDEAMAASTAMGQGDDEFLRELGIDPKDPMGEARDDTEMEAEGEAEDDDNDEEGEDEDETPGAENEEAADDVDGDDDSVAQIDMAESEPAVAKSASRRKPDTSNLAELLLEANADKSKVKDATDAGISKKRLRKQPRRTTKARTSA